MNIVKLILISALTITSVFSTTSLLAADMKVAVVNVQEAIESSHHWDKIKAKLNKEFSPLETDLKTQVDAINALQERLVKDAAIMGEAEARRLQQEIAQKGNTFKFEERETQRKFSQRQQELSLPVLKLADATLQQIIKAEKYDLVLPRQAVIHFDETYNITKKLTEKLNKAK